MTAKARPARRNRRLAPALILLIGLIVTGAGYAVAAPRPEAPTAPSQADVAEGAKLFQTNCSACHGAAAEGTENAPSLIGVGAAAVDFQVATGRMPMAFNGAQAPAKPAQFDDEQRAQLAAFVASLGAGPQIPSTDQVDPAGGDPATGMNLFRTNCAMCHAASAAGGALSQGKSAPSLLSTDPTQIYEAMATGPQSMPVFNDANLTPQDKQDIISYIDQLQRNGSPGGADLGGTGPVSEGLIAWVLGLGLLIGCAIWLGAKAS